MLNDLRSALRRRPRLSGEHWVLIGLAGMLVVVTLANQWGVLTPDTKPEVFLAPWQTAARFGQWWLDGPYLGVPNFNVGIAPVAAVQGILQWVIPAPWLAMRVWRILLLLTAAAGARRLFAELSGSRSSAGSLGRIVCAVAYVANPYLLLGGNTTPTLLPYALLPWVVVFWLRGFRDGGWRPAAAAALLLAAMSGLNTGVVVAIQLVVVVPAVAHALLVEGHRPARVAGTLGRSALLYLGMSLYWLVPAVGALAVGSSVAGATESLAVINSASSAPEVLRGLGFWPLYGRGSNGPFQPQLASLLTSAPVIVLSFLPPVLAILGAAASRSRARLFAVLAVLTGAVTMIGAFPYADPALAGRGLRWALENIPGAIALRTTNKAGGVLELGLAILVALAATAAYRVLSRVVRPDTVRRTLVGTVACAACFGSVLPAFRGDLFAVTMSVPKYWRDAAQVVNTVSPSSRVLVVPGLSLADYSWKYSGPDDVGNSLFEGESTHRITTPIGNSATSSMLSGIDQRLYAGNLPVDGISTLARLIGATSVVARLDQRFPSPVGAVVEPALAADPGLTPLGAFGPQEAGNGATHPVSVYRVDGPPLGATIRSGGGVVLLEGDGSALVDLASAGRLPEGTSVVLAGSLTAAERAEAAAAGARLALTDTNARQDWNGQSPDRRGPVVRGSDPTHLSYAMFGSDSQTVSQLEGVSEISTSGSGLLFGPFGGGGPELAFDGDRSTAWRFGNFGGAVGNAVNVTLSEATEFSSVAVQPTVEDGRRVTAVRVDVRGPGGAAASVSADIDAWAALPTSIAVPSGRYDRVSVTVTAARSDNFGPVGIAEIAIPGVQVRKVLRLPTQAATALGQGQGTTTPVDVYLSRRTSADEMAREEPGLNRDFTLPAAQTFTVSGRVQLATGASDEAIDQLSGHVGPDTFTSSSRWDWDPSARASLAFDADPATAWSPSDPIDGEWIRAQVMPVQLSSFTVSQIGAGTATRAWIRVNEGAPFEVRLTPGTTTVYLPTPTLVKDLRLIVLAHTGTGPVRISEIGIPHERATPTPPGDCHIVGRLDGAPLTARLGGSVDDVLQGRTVEFTGCSPVDVAVGDHELRTAGPFVIDDLRLLSEAGPPPKTVEARVLHASATSTTLHVDQDCSGCIVTSRQGFDPRWRATVHGKDLGKPFVVDGYASAWRVSLKAGDVVTMSYAPSRWTPWVWLCSLLVVLGAAASVWWRREGVAPSTVPADLVPGGPPTKANLVVVGCIGALGAGLTFGVALGVAIAALVAVAALLRRPQVLTMTAAVAVIAMVAVWFIGVSGPLVVGSSRIQGNFAAHQLGGLALWAICLGVILEVVGRTRPQVGVSPEDRVPPKEAAGEL